MKYRRGLGLCLFCLANVFASRAMGQLVISMSPTHVRVSPGDGTLSLPVFIAADDSTTVTNVDVSLSAIPRGDGSDHTISIESFSLTSRADSIWSPGVTALSVPALPSSPNAVLSAFQFTPAAANGSVFEAELLLQGAQVGDIYDLDLNAMNNSTVGSLLENLTGQTSFVPGQIIVVTDPSLVADFDGDGDVDVDDIDLFMVGLQTETSDTYYDLDGSGILDAADRDYLIETTFGTWYGDSNLDGLFDTTDLITVFQAGKYEDDHDGNATWADGDWSGDRDFNTTDLIIAFQAAGYEQGPRPAVTAVPEPASCVVLWQAIFVFGLQFRRRRSARALKRSALF